MSETDGNKNKELMNALNSVKKVNVGDVVNAEILAIDDNKQLIVGIEDSGVEGVVPPRELSSKPIKNINDDFKVGDKIKVLVVTKIGGDKEGGSYVLSIRRVQSRKVWDKIQAKANAKETITVPVSRAVRGGLVVDAGVRGFIPASMITDHFVRDLNQFNGKDLECKIIEVVPEKNRLILSHRAIVEKKDKAARDKVMSEINEGDTVEGKVARLTNFGAFIDLGGIDGLVHISQISYAHVNKPSDVLKVGQEVKVKVMSIDEDRDRISLSMKALEPEPWDNIEEKAPKGSIITGTVKRLVDFGAFVEVTPGVEGLLHISQISHQHVNTPSDVLKVGQEIKVKVLDVQPENHRLSLSMRALEPNPDDNDKKTPKHNVSDHSKTNAPDEENGFTLGDIVGNELKKEENNKKNK